MQEKRFQKNDQGFVCLNCGKVIPPNLATSRDHCPFCLYSMHVDLLPGDRKNPCRGTLVPISCQPHPKKGFVLIYRCEKCGDIVRNKAALTGEEPDQMEKLIALTANPMEETK